MNFLDSSHRRMIPIIDLENEYSKSQQKINYTQEIETMKLELQKLTEKEKLKKKYFEKCQTLLNEQDILPNELLLYELKKDGITLKSDICELDEKIKKNSSKMQKTNEDHNFLIKSNLLSKENLVLTRNKVNKSGKKKIIELATNCIECCEKPKDIIFLGCNHLGQYCHSCYQNLKKKNKTIKLGITKCQICKYKFKKFVVNNYLFSSDDFMLN